MFPAASCFSVLRDLTSRGSFMLITAKLIEFYKEDLERDNKNRFHIYFASAIIATFLSHPFDVMFTKLASQR